MYSSGDPGCIMPFSGLAVAPLGSCDIVLEIAFRHYDKINEIKNFIKRKDLFWPLELDVPIQA